MSLKIARLITNLKKIIINGNKIKVATSFQIMTTFNKTIFSVSPNKIRPFDATYAQFTAVELQDGETELEFIEGKLIEVNTGAEVACSNCVFNEDTRSEMLIDGIDENAPSGKYRIEIAFNSNLGNLQAVHPFWNWSQ